MPTIRFSMGAPSHLVAGQHVEAADHEKEHHHSDINDVHHSWSIIQGAVIIRQVWWRRKIKTRLDGVKNV
jgi:hypothetical protein